MNCCWVCRENLVLRMELGVFASFGIFRAGSEWSLPRFFLRHSVIYLPQCSLSSNTRICSARSSTPQSSQLGPSLRRLPHWPAFRSARRALGRARLVSYLARFCSLTSFTCLAFLALIVYASLYAASLSLIYNAPMYTHPLTI